VSDLTAATGQERAEPPGPARTIQLLGCASYPAPSPGSTFPKLGNGLYDGSGKSHFPPNRMPNPRRRSEPGSQAARGDINRPGSRPDRPTRKLYAAGRLTSGELKPACQAAPPSGRCGLKFAASRIDAIFLPAPRPFTTAASKWVAKSSALPHSAWLRPGSGTDEGTGQTCAQGN